MFRVLGQSAPPLPRTLAVDPRPVGRGVRSHATPASNPSSSSCRSASHSRAVRDRDRERLSGMVVHALFTAPLAFLGASSSHPSSPVSRPRSPGRHVSETLELRTSASSCSWSTSRPTLSAASSITRSAAKIRSSAIASRIASAGPASRLDLAGRPLHGESAVERFSPNSVTVCAHLRLHLLRACRQQSCVIGARRRPDSALHQTRRLRGDRSQIAGTCFACRWFRKNDRLLARPSRS